MAFTFDGVGRRAHQPGFTRTGFTHHAGHGVAAIKDVEGGFLLLGGEACEKFFRLFTVRGF